MRKFVNVSMLGLAILAMPSISWVSGEAGDIFSATAAVSTGTPAPDFSFTVDGTRHSLSDFRGHVVVLDFWASWCPYCVRSLPMTEAIHKSFDDVVVLGVDNEDSRTILEAKEDLGLSFPTVQDTSNTVSAKYGADSIPLVVVIAPDGTVAAKIGGYQPEDPLLPIVEALR